MVVFRILFYFECMKLCAVSGMTLLLGVLALAGVNWRLLCWFRWRLYKPLHNNCGLIWMTASRRKKFTLLTVSCDTWEFATSEMKPGTSLSLGTWIEARTPDAVQWLFYQVCVDYSICVVESIEFNVCSTRAHTLSSDKSEDTSRPGKVANGASQRIVLRDL